MSRYRTNSIQLKSLDIIVAHLDDLLALAEGLGLCGEVAEALLAHLHALVGSTAPAQDKEEKHMDESIGTCGGVPQARG